LNISSPPPKTPLPGRFFCDRFILSGFGLLLASLLMPLHFLPWLSWHSEILAFASMLVLSAGMIKVHHANRSRTLALPEIVWPLAVLGLVIALQALTGQIGFFGDAAVLIFYLLLCVFTMAVGHSVACSPKQSRAEKTVVVDRFAMLMLVGGVSSVVVALAQTLDIWESVGLVARMHSLRRPGGNVGQPNHLATLTLLSIASALYLFELRKMRTLIAAPSVAILMMGLAITESRSGVVGLVVMATWWLVKRRAIGFTLSARAIGLWFLFFSGCFGLWPTAFNFIQEGGWTPAALAQVNTNAGTRLVVWPQLWQAVLIHPWSGWGLREVSTAHNAVLHSYPDSEAFAYAHNIVLDLALGVGLPLTILLTGVAAIWLWRRMLVAKDLLSWYCLAGVLAFGVHSMLEYPFAYAYFLVPVTFLAGILEARTAPARGFRMPLRVAAIAWGLTFMAMSWSVVEYIKIEEDFRIVRFEAMRMGQTPIGYKRPKIYLLTQLEALLEEGRAVPMPGMAPDRIELARKVALRFAWSATQNRYALSLALNGNPEEAIRQLKVMRATLSKKDYASIKAHWETLAGDKYPQLSELAFP
jgi:O-antigen ligase